MINIKDHLFSRRFFIATAIIFFVPACVSPNKINGNKDLFQKNLSNFSDNRRDITIEEESVPELTSEEHERHGDVSFSKKELQMAYVHYVKSLKADPDNTRVKFKKAQLLVVGGMSLEAKKEFEEILKKEPDNPAAQAGLGEVYYQLKKYAEAEQYMLKSIKADSKYWRSHNLLGIIYDYTKQYGKAVKEYEAAITLNPGNADLYNNLGLSYSMAGDYEKSIKSFNKGIAINSSDNKIYNNLGLVYARLGKYDEALECFKKQGSEAQAYNNLGCVYLWKDDHENAQKSFEKAIELNPAFYDRANENLKKSKVYKINAQSFDFNRKAYYETEHTKKLEPSIESSQQKKNYKKYVVQRGDTLTEISGKFNSTVNDIMTINQLKTELIKTGQKLLIPEND